MCNKTIRKTEIIIGVNLSIGKIPAPLIKCIFKIENQILQLLKQSALTSPEVIPEPLVGKRQKRKKFNDLVN